MNRSREFEEIRRHWTPPRELLGSPPREVKFGGAGIFLALLGVCLALGAAVGAPLLAREALRQRANYRRVLAEGQNTNARVARLWIKKGENKRSMVEYRFAVDGRTYRKETSVPSALWKTLSVDGPIRVTFLRSNPELNYLENRPKRPMPIAVPIVVGMGTLLLALLVARVLVRSRELLTQGKVAPAVITKVHKISTENGTSRVLHYEYALPSGSVARGKSSCDRKGVDTGSVVSVVYDPDQTRRSAIYPMQLVKVRRDG